MEKYFFPQFAMNRGKLTKRMWLGSFLIDAIISVCMEGIIVLVLMAKIFFLNPGKQESYET